MNLPMFFISESKGETKKDLNSRYIIPKIPHKIICIFNHNHQEWSIQDEKLLQIALKTLNETGEAELLK
jgi:hypothetical protein